MILKGHALDLIEQLTETPDLIVTDPPYAFGGTGDEHAISATVATVLRESARRLAKGRWMLVMCAASWRSQAYMVEAVRGVVEPVRVATWCKPKARTKVQTTGWAWASVKVIAFRKGKALDIESPPYLDHITEPPFMEGRKAQLPASVADWMVAPFAVSGGLALDPFAGSGSLCYAAERHGMRALGYEKNAAPLPAPTSERGADAEASDGHRDLASVAASDFELNASAPTGGDVSGPYTQPDQGETDRRDGPQFLKPCPKCGGETAVQKWTAQECAFGDTSVRYCIECEWKADPE